MRRLIAMLIGTIGLCGLTLAAEPATHPIRLGADTDADGLSDYEETCKYGTDPARADSDADGTPDGDWNERREYTYTIRALCEIRPPNKLERMSDLYQDVRLSEGPAHSRDGTIVELILYPYATPPLAPSTYPVKPYPRECGDCLRPTLGINYTPQMQADVCAIVGDAKTDVEATQHILNWISANTRLTNTIPEFAYFRVQDDQVVWIASRGSAQADADLLQTNFFGESMFRRRVHGTCSSLAMLRATMFRAAGLPARLVQTLPLIARYEDDHVPLADRMRKRLFARGYEWTRQRPAGVNHMYNEVFLGGQWVRVDETIGCNLFVGDKVFVKVYFANDANNLFPIRPAEEAWNEERDFRTLDVTDQHAIHASAMPQAQSRLAVSDSDLSLVRLDDGRYEATLRVHNRGPVPSDEVEVELCAVRRDGSTRPISWHGVGPVMPNAVWGERNPGFRLEDDEIAVRAVVGPDHPGDERVATQKR